MSEMIYWNERLTHRVLVAKWLTRRAFLSLRALGYPDPNPDGIAKDVTFFLADFVGCITCRDDEKNTTLQAHYGRRSVYSTWVLCRKEHKP